MRIVVIESPYGTNVDGSRADAETVGRNVRYARACMADALSKGEAPYASHLLYTQPKVLRDGEPEERRKGMEAGWEFYRVADAIVVYLDLGVTDGMKRGIERAFSTAPNPAQVQIEYRKLGEKWDQ